MRRLGLVLIALIALAAEADAVVVRATYRFQDTLAADERGVPALVALDPLNADRYEQAIVFNSGRRTYRWGGSSADGEQGGLLAFSAFLVPPDNYSAEMVFQFGSGANSWRRIIDVEDGVSDAGLYVDSGNNLNVFPAGSGNTVFALNRFYYLALTQSFGTTKVYLNGRLEFEAQSTVMDIVNGDSVMNLFLDNYTNGPTMEWAPGRIAFFRLSQGALTDEEVARVAVNPFTVEIPEPAGLGVIGILTLLAASRQCAAEVRTRTPCPATSIIPPSSP